ncbi:imidazole glycerol phosphate synthase subunit HisH [Roseivirga sp. UBA838]|uniref:imidazole glycerol phosphate synthase subunit HisH n=1 Tax=Roseivirga sp. UBA838 TaxID=1947393 RepID=UPI00257A3F3A|nr:imidazole glycerol phosphate synthase subunit HisH [Roseivirga sp. UBA838]|tara:strand:- start:45197 stop:45823 length:627 start_codon:yes stop_codon:yes gene_type:complete
MITIVDYGMGNLGSVLNMLKRIGVPARISEKLEDIDDSDKLILPGVGAFDMAIKRIDQTGLREVLNRKVLKEGTPILGICLGMQLLTNSSEEGVLPGLGFIDANTVKFNKELRLKIPHMGWNEVTKSNPSPLTQDIENVSEFDENARFYFVHSYKVLTNNPEDSILTCVHGTQKFDAAIQRGHIYGAQFHPEKSHRFGMKLLENFAKI